MKVRAVYFLLIAGAFSCSQGNKTTVPNTENAYIRPAPEGGNSAAYLAIVNQFKVADTLEGIESKISDNVQIHESYKTEDGLMGMREVEEIILKPDSMLTLEPGGLHMMLMNLQRALVSGDSLSVVMHWKQKGADTLRLAVQ